MAARHFVIENVALTSAKEVIYTVPADTSFIVFQPKGGVVQMRHEAAGANWTMAAGEKETLDMRTLPSEEFILFGLDGTTMQIQRFTDLLS